MFQWCQTLSVCCTHVSAAAVSVLKSVSLCSSCDSHVGQAVSGDGCAGPGPTVRASTSTPRGKQLSTGAVALLTGQPTCHCCTWPSLDSSNVWPSGWPCACSRNKLYSWGGCSWRSSSWRASSMAKIKERCANRCSNSWSYSCCKQRCSCCGAPSDSSSSGSSSSGRPSCSRASLSVHPRCRGRQNNNWTSCCQPTWFETGSQIAESAVKLLTKERASVWTRTVRLGFIHEIFLVGQLTGQHLFFWI